MWLIKKIFRKKTNLLKNYPKIATKVFLNLKKNSKITFKLMYKLTMKNKEIKHLIH